MKWIDGCNLRSMEGPVREVTWWWGHRSWQSCKPRCWYSAGEMWQDTREANNQSYSMGFSSCTLPNEACWVLCFTLLLSWHKLPIIVAWGKCFFFYPESKEESKDCLPRYFLTADIKLNIPNPFWNLKCSGVGDFLSAVGMPQVH